MASSAGKTGRADAAARGLSVVRPPEPTEQLAGVLAELLTWLRSRNPAPALPDPVELTYVRMLSFDPPVSQDVVRAKMEATLARLRVKAGKMQLQELQALGLTLRLDGERILVSPGNLVTDDLRQRIERSRAYLIIALHDSELGQ